MRKLLFLVVFVPLFSHAQKFYIADIDKSIYNTLKNRISYLGYSITTDKNDADFVTEVVYEKKKGYMSFKGGYNKVGFIRFADITGQELAKTKEQGGLARGYNTYSALSSLFKKIMKTDFDSTINAVAKTYIPKPKDGLKSTISNVDELAKLKKLFDDGVLTKEEFESEKKKILDRR